MYYVPTRRFGGMVALRDPDHHTLRYFSDRSKAESWARKLNDARTGG